MSKTEHSVPIFRGDMIENKPTYTAVRTLVGEVRASMRFKCDLPGSSRRGLFQSEKDAIYARVTKIMEDRGWNRYKFMVVALRKKKFRRMVEGVERKELKAAVEQVVVPQLVETAVLGKRKRLSADKRLAKEAALDDNQRPTRRRRLDSS